jgi:DNA-binding Lrp family transcriptional regulator
VITTIVLIRVDPSLIPKAAHMLAGVEGVSEVYSVSGEWDLVAIVRVAEYDQIAQVVLAQGSAAGLGHRRRIAAAGGGGT